jgi:hypothetical protein
MRASDLHFGADNHVTTVARSTFDIVAIRFEDVCVTTAPKFAVELARYLRYLPILQS